MLNPRERLGIAAHPQHTYIVGVLAPKAQDVREQVHGLDHEL
jgi:hypothetical protein